MQQRQGWMRDFLLEQGQEALGFVGSVGLQDDSTNVAAGIRAALSLSNDWARQESTWTEALRTLREATEGAGILVVINGIVDVNFASFIKIVDTLGCVYVNVDHRYLHINGEGGEAYSEINLQPGYQKLCYNNALSYVRYRHGDSDFVRVARPGITDDEVMKRVLLAHAMLLTLRGVPVVYYGDEQYLH